MAEEVEAGELPAKTVNNALGTPLAELLIGSGLRISEALALRVGDLELEETGVPPLHSCKTLEGRSGRRPQDTRKGRRASVCATE